VNLLLDTHAVLWWLQDIPRLGRGAAAAIADRANRCFISAASVFEIETKHRLGKLTLPLAMEPGWETTLASEAWELLTIGLAHARHAARLGGEHGDPFDRLLAAQADLENLILVTCDPAFVSFGTRTLW
jgi:PIN domain nuclease of toxin-antitoxin system